jgi:hypothetical protein
VSVVIGMAIDFAQKAHVRGDFEFKSESNGREDGLD